MTDHHRQQTSMEVLIGTRESLRFLLGEVEGVGLDAVSDAIRKALEVVEVATRARLS